jgi:hypothetical protein
MSTTPKELASLEKAQREMILASYEIAEVAAEARRITEHLERAALHHSNAVEALKRITRRHIPAETTHATA